MKKTTLPPEEIDGEITIWGYYKENEEAISERFYRKAESTRNGYLSCMSGTLCEITSTVLAEAELSDMQLLMNQLIVAKRHTGKEYSRARVDTFQYLIYTTFLFATEKKKIMFNPLWGTSWGKHSSDPDTKKKKTKGLNEERKEKQPKRNDKKAEKGCRKCLKSLTLEQEVLLTKYIKENHKKEGIPEQITMLSGITAVFGIPMEKATLSAIISATIGTSGTTVLGKTIVAGLLKFIPGAGSAIGGAISATTAAALTAALGSAYIQVLMLISNGKLNISDLVTNKGKKLLSDTFFKQLRLKRNKNGEVIE